MSEELTGDELAQAAPAEKSQAEESQAEEAQTEEAQTEESQAEEAQTEEAQAAEVAPGEEAPELEIPSATGEPNPPDTEPLDAEEYAITIESVDTERARIKAIIEAVIYITDEPLSTQQIAGALNQPIATINGILDELTADYSAADRGLNIREVAGGFKMGTKPEHHEEIRAFVKNLKPPLKLSLAALETLAVIAYKQPITAPEIMDIRGVQGAGVLKTLLDRKLIATAGRKNVIGKPILYKTTREFLLQFGLKDLTELPTLKEFEELGRLALSDEEASAGSPDAVVESTPASEPEPEPPVEEPPPDEPPVEDPSPETPPVEEPGEPDSPERTEPANG